MQEALPKDQLTEILIRGQEQRIPGLRVVQHALVVDSRLQRAYVGDRVAGGPQGRDDRADVAADRSPPAKPSLTRGCLCSSEPRRHGRSRAKTASVSTGGESQDSDNLPELGAQPCPRARWSPSLASQQEQQNMPNAPAPPHIAISPTMAGGQPHIEGRRIKVRDVAFQHEYLGRGTDEIAAELDLTLAEVHAALAYYFDYRDEIEQTVADRETFVAAMKGRTPSLLFRKLAAAADG